jgi:hypothetical protein
MWFGFKEKIQNKDIKTILYDVIYTEIGQA